MFLFAFRIFRWPGLKGIEFSGISADAHTRRIYNGKKVSLVELFGAASAVQFGRPCSGIDILSGFAAFAAIILIRIVSCKQSDNRPLCRSKHFLSYPETIAVYIGETAVPAEMEVLVPDDAPKSAEYKQFTADLFDYLGKTVYIAFVNHNCEDCYYVFIDDIEISLKEPEPEPTPAPEDFVAGYYFESDPAEEGWQFVDADGDGLTWMWQMVGVNYGYESAYEGEGLLSSASYANSTGPPS